MILITNLYGKKNQTRISTVCFRGELQIKFNSYIQSHYPNGTVSVYDVSKDKLIICIVDTKYSPNNFWNGRWKSTITINPKSSKIISHKVNIHIHYYEDGNVQLALDKEIGKEVVFDKLLEVVKKSEGDFHMGLMEGYAGLSEGFKGLRRALPVFKTKIDWATIGSCKKRSCII